MLLLIYLTLIPYERVIPGQKKSLGRRVTVVRIQDPTFLAKIGQPIENILFDN